MLTLTPLLSAYHGFTEEDKEIVYVVIGTETPLSQVWKYAKTRLSILSQLETLNKHHVALVDDQASLNSR